LENITEKTLERQSFNALYAEALPIVKSAVESGDKMEEDIYFESIEKNYKRAQKDFEDCTKSSSACTDKVRKQKMQAAKKALRAYNASLDVKFKAEEAAKQDELVPE